MINVLINGCNGAMGKTLKQSIDNTEDIFTICGVDKIDTGDNDFPVFTCTDCITEIPDVVIDFSSPIASINILEFSKKNSIPVVIATTGFSNVQIKLIQNFSKSIPIFLSSNMSIEINLLSILVSKLATILTSSDIEIIETHHKNKKDAPSGTALMLANSINSALNNSLFYTYSRKKSNEKRRKNEIGIHSVRGGTEVGKHSILFLGNDESLEITHTVTSRKVFADGAIDATRFIMNKKPGLYGMNDLIKISF